MLTQERLKELLEYDPESGVFTWYKRNNKWGASVLHEGRRHFAGLFDCVHEAGRAAETLRQSLFTHHRTGGAA